MGAIPSQITSLTIVYSTVYSDADKKNLKAPRHHDSHWLDINYDFSFTRTPCYKTHTNFCLHYVIAGMHSLAGAKPLSEPRLEFC